MCIYKFSSGDYVFLYSYDENNFVGLVQTTPESSDAPEYEIPD